jgi:hypothetical protein
MERGKIVLAFLPIALLLASIGASAATPVRTAGVSAGDTFTYGNVSFNWYSDDPTATPPAEWAGLNGTAYSVGAIENVAGTNVTVISSIHYNNGTVRTEGGWVDVDTGNSVNMSFILISANLNAGDSIYSNSTYLPYTINETISETYPGGSRQTNHMNTTMEASYGSYYIYSSMNLYWDRATGVITKLSIIMNSTTIYTTDWFISFNLTGSNKWVVPEFVGLPSTVPLLALLPLVVLVRRRRLHKTRNR